MYKRLQGDSLGCRERHFAPQTDSTKEKPEGVRKKREVSQSLLRKGESETGWEKENRKCV